MPIENVKRKVLVYSTEQGFEPSNFYIKNLADHIARAKIRLKINKAAQGNFGQEGVSYRHLIKNIWELKVHYGPGYRIYFSIKGGHTIFILCTGNKKTQQKDINRAQHYLKECQSREVKI